MLININKSLTTSGKRVSGLLLGLACVALVGCSNKWSGKSKHHRHKQESAMTQGVGESTEFINKDREESEHRAQHHASNHDKDTYLFAFDRFDVSEHDLASIHQHADYLKTHRDKKIYIYGHTDMRGSREYNIALGERRAKAVTQVLLARGVLPKQIVVVSYGAEKPAEQGSNENAYSKNRRAQAVYE